MIKNIKAYVVIAVVASVFTYLMSLSSFNEKIGKLEEVASGYFTKIDLLKTQVEAVTSENDSLLNKVIDWQTAYDSLMANPKVITKTIVVRDTVFSKADTVYIETVVLASDTLLFEFPCEIKDSFGEIRFKFKHKLNIQVTFDNEGKFYFPSDSEYGIQSFEFSPSKDLGREKIQFYGGVDFGIASGKLYPALCGDFIFKEKLSVGISIGQMSANFKLKYRFLELLGL